MEKHKHIETRFTEARRRINAEQGECDNFAKYCQHMSDALHVIDDAAISAERREDEEAVLRLRKISTELTWALHYASHGLAVSEFAQNVSNEIGRAISPHASHEPAEDKARELAQHMGCIAKQLLEERDVTVFETESTHRIHLEE